MFASLFYKIGIVLKYAKLNVHHYLARKTLVRVPEMAPVTTDPKVVGDYDHIMTTIMTLPYALALDYIDRVVGETKARALDLCCGPGLFSRLLATQLGYQKVIGVDLSDPMIATAKKNSQQMHLVSQVEFQKGSVFQLSFLEDQSFDLVTFCHGAHQFAKLAEVTQSLKEAERVTKKDGVIFVLDPVRQKSAALTKSYIKIAGQDYLDQNLTHFYKQFDESLFASWSAEELASAIPGGTKRQWFQVMPHGIPMFQMLIGVPASQKTLFQRPSRNEKLYSKVVAPHKAFEWVLFRQCYKLGSVKKITPRSVPAL